MSENPPDKAQHRAQRVLIVGGGEVREAAYDKQQWRQYPPIRPHEYDIFFRDTFSPLVNDDDSIVLNAVTLRRLKTTIDVLAAQLEATDRQRKVEAERANHHAKQLRDAVRKPSVDAGGIYIASRTRHASRWREARDQGVPITSTWIDEAGEGETKSLLDLWDRCIDEARTAAAVILFREDEELLKGALIEAGAALGAGRPVFTVGFNGPTDMKTFSFLNHRMVVRCDTVEIAFALAGELVRSDIPTEKGGGDE